MHEFVSKTKTKKNLILLSVESNGSRAHLLIKSDLNKNGSFKWMTCIGRQYVFDMNNLVLVCRLDIFLCVLKICSVYQAQEMNANRILNRTPIICMPFSILIFASVGYVFTSHSFPLKQFHWNVNFIFNTFFSLVHNKRWPNASQILCAISTS